VYELSAASAYDSYLWSTHALTDSISISQSGYYSLTVTDSSGCSISGEVHYVSPSLPAALLGQDTVSVCRTQYPVTITADSGFSQYLWNGIAGGREYVIDSPRLIYAEGITQCGIVRDTITALILQEDVGLSYGIDSDCTQNIAKISVEATGTPSILWSTGATSSLLTTPLPQLLIVSARYQCSVIYDTINIPGCAFFTHHLYIPNAFTPNGDGVNDAFEVFGDKVNWQYADIRIYDRWGEKVFESNDLDFKWDGYYKGAVTEGVYVYTLSLAYTDGTARSAKGSITLIR
jgi:gliding motility-associated-like protein